MDPLNILGLAPGASEKEIKAAFKKLAKKHHPDMTGGDEQKFKEINEAYSILTGKQEQPQAPGPNPFDSFENIFGAMFRGGGGNNRVINRVHVDPEMLLNGGSFEYQYQVYENRNGRVTPVRKSTLIRVEADSPAGIQIAVPGTQPNHIILQLIPGSTKRYTVGEMFNLTEIHTINVFTAICGGETEVTTPLGKKIMLKIPAGTQSGTIHRIPMSGLRMANDIRGDYNVHLIVDIPKIEGSNQQEREEKILVVMKEYLK